MTSPTPKSRTDYESIVRSPGKFEGCAPYVPYLWDMAVADGCPSDFEGTLHIQIERVDIAMFPELAGIKEVEMLEDDQGFVRELNPTAPIATDLVNDLARHLSTLSYTRNQQEVVQQVADFLVTRFPRMSVQHFLHLAGVR